MTKLPCTLHLGAPQTGSTVIQEALFFHLGDRRFQSVGSGEPNGSDAFSCLFQPQEAPRLAGLLGPRMVESLRNRRAPLAELSWQARQRIWTTRAHWTAGC